MEIIIPIIILVIGVLCGVAFGWNLREYVASAKLSKLLDQMEQDNQNLSEVLIPIIIEKHNDEYFVYDLKDKTFMAQGQTRWHLEKCLNDKFPGKTFAASPENLKEMGFE
jgi:hypothetical protein